MRVLKTLLPFAFLMLGACSMAPYQFETREPTVLQERAVVQSAGSFQVRAAVPGAEEAESLLGIDVYARDIQPVWLEIRNDSDLPASVAIASIDPKYFPPAEVAWFFKKEFSKQGWMDLERRLIDLSLPRLLDAGETVSGFVFTNRSPGTKAFSLDVFGGAVPVQYEEFTFFLRVPGFVPDYAKVRFEELYADEDVQQFSRDRVPEAIAGFECCTRSSDGARSGRPVNLYAVSEPPVLLKSLLRAGWIESIATRDDEDPGAVNFLFGRLPDGIFRKPRDGTTDRTELAVWKTPALVDGKPLWALQVRHAVGHRYPLGERLFGVRLDPDVDEARNYVLQTFWYAQTLQEWGLSPTGQVVSQESAELDLLGNPWFSVDPYDFVIWLSDEPVPMNAAAFVEWKEGDSRPGGGP